MKRLSDKRQISIFRSIILIGDTWSGKSALVYRFISKEYHFIPYPTTGIDNCSLKYEVNDGNKSEIILITIWDTTGAELFSPLIKQYIKKVQGIMVVYNTREHDGCIICG